MLILFVLGMSSYEVPRLIGRPARIDVFTTDIQSAIIQTPPEFGVASALALALLMVCIVAVFFYRRATRHAEAFATITGKGYMPTRINLGVWRWPVADRHRLDVRAGARPAAVDAGVAILLPQPGAALHGLGRALHARQLPVRAELPDLPRGREDQRRAGRHGGHHHQRPDLRHGLDRAALGSRASAGFSTPSRSPRSRSRA